MDAAYKIAVIIFQIILGACYVKLQTVFMTQYIKLFGNAITDIQIIVGVLLPLIPNLIILFTANHYLFKTNPRSLGSFAGALAFMYFYIVSHSEPAITLIIQTILNIPTLINMLLMVAVPIIIGIALNKSLNQTGAHDAPPG